MNRSGARAWLPVLLLAPPLVLGFHSLCALLFSCGCRPIWAGGIDHCNVHQAGVPHCPFCAGGTGRFAWVALLIALGAFAGVAIGRRRGLTGALLGGTFGYLGAALLAGLAAALLDGYPSLLGLRL